MRRSLRGALSRVDRLAGRFTPSRVERVARLRTMSNEELYAEVMELANEAGGLDALFIQCGVDRDQFAAEVAVLRDRCVGIAEG